MSSRVTLVVATIIAGSVAAGSLNAQAPVEKVHVVITGGANAGTYDAVGTRGGCSANATGPGSFGNQLSDPKGAPTAFNSLQLVVPKPVATGTAEFQMIVGFGPLMHRTATYEVNTLAATAKKAGSGTAKVTQTGNTAQVTIAAMTKDGVKIDATISCLSVTKL